MKGLFIVMEGPDGSGKTTQINLLKEYLEEAGYECLITREPGGTVIGEEVRQLILNPEHKEMSPVTEMLLYAASRAQLVHEVIGPALEEGKIVISDRFVDSSIVYQGIARKLGISTVSAVNAPGIGIYRPDGIFFIDLSEAEAMSIARFERGTGLISTNSNNLIVDFKASQLEKDLITTDRKDLQELKERLQKYGRQAYGKQAI